MIGRANFETGMEGRGRYFEGKTKMTSQSDDRERELRVFISSTFRDMHAERDELVKRVFPQIRKLCEERDVVWSEVDLRWGVTDEQKAEGATLPLCLAEIDKCRPYFIGLLGERYGWVPDEFSPAAIDRAPWLTDRLGSSVTELEILHGVLNDPAKSKRAYFYFRDPAFAKRSGHDPSIYLERPTETEIASLGPDAAEKLAESRRRKLTELKTRIQASGCRVRDGYGDQAVLGDLVLRDLTDLIERLFPKEHRRSELDTEARAQEAYVRSRTRTLVSRPKQSEKLRQFLYGSDRGLVVSGSAGAGKSMTLAELFAGLNVRNDWGRLAWLRRIAGAWRDVAAGRPLVIGHFVGASPNSADWKVLVKRILGETRRRYLVPLRIPDDPFDLRTALATWLPRLPGKAILILDGLDQLEDVEEALDLTWLPDPLPANVKIVASASEGKTIEVLRRRKWSESAIAPLNVEERQEFVTAYLQRFGKELGPARRARICNAPAAGDPLFLAALLEELRLFGMHEALDQKIGVYVASRDSDELYAKLLDRYERDYERDRPGLVRDVMSLLSSARRGLTESDLLALLGEGNQPLPRLYLTPLLLAVERLLIGRSGALAIANDPLRRAVRRKFLASPQDQLRAHRRLAAHFRNEPLSQRVVDELLWQQKRGEEWERLKETLVDFEALDLLMERTGAERQYDLFACWRSLEGRFDPVESYRAAADKLVAGQGDLAEVARRLTIASALLQAMGHPSGARALTERAMSLHGRSSKRDPDAVVSELVLLGRTYQVENRLQEAFDAFERARDLSAQSWGRDCEEYAICVASLAGVLYLQGKREEALPSFDQAVAILTNLFGAEDERVLMALGNQATVLSRCGSYLAARKLAQHVLDVRLRLRGTDSLETADALSALATIDSHDGRVEEAIASYERALATREPALGRDHPKTVDVLHNLASCYMQRGIVARARPLFQRCLEATRIRYGEEHRRYAEEAVCLAECHRQMKEFDEALKWYRRALAVFERSKDAFHLSFCLHNLGALYLVWCKPEEAIATLERALKLREESLGSDHDETGKTMMQLGIAQGLAGDVEKAIDLCTRGMRTMEAKLGPEHPEVRDAARRMGVGARSLGIEGLAEHFERLAGVASPVAPATRVAAPDGAQQSPPPSPEAIAAAQERVRVLSREIEILSTTSLSRERFFAEFLSRAGAATSALGGAVWRADRSEDVFVEAQSGLPPECRPDSQHAARHFQLLRHLAKPSASASAPPRAWLPDAPEVSNPTPFVLLIVCLFGDDDGAFVAELVLEAQEPDVVRSRYEAFRRLCSFATGYLDRVLRPADTGSPAVEWHRQSGAATVEEARRVVIQLTEEIRFLSQIDLPPESLLKEFFIRFLKAVQPIGGAIWNVGYLGGLTVQVEATLPVERSPDGAFGGSISEILRFAARSERIVVLPPGTTGPEPERVVNRTPYLLFVAKLADADEGAFVCLTAFSDKPDKKVLDGYIRYFAQVRLMVAQALNRHYRGV